MNPRIKTLHIDGALSSPISFEGFNRFCSAMEYYAFEELTVQYSYLPPQCHEALYSALKYNQSIKKISIRYEPIKGSPFNVLCETLMSNPTTTDLTIEATPLDEQNYAQLNKVLKRNHLTKLRLMQTGMHPNLFKLISRALRKSTSVTDLELIDQPIDWKILGKILGGNNTIKTLDISQGKFKDYQFELLNLRSNTTLTALTFVDCKVDGTAFFRELCENKTLKRLTLGSNDGSFLAKDPMVKYLTEDCPLEELKLFLNHSQRARSHVIDALSEALKVNKTLRRLDLDVNAIPHDLFEKLIETLKGNKSLLEFNFCGWLKNIFLSYKHVEYSPKEKQRPFLDYLSELLRTNKTLRYIEGANEFPDWEEQLKRNRAWQDKIIGGTRMWINMILMKPNSFILPLEVWSMVFKYASYEFSPLNFELFFRK